MRAEKGWRPRLLEIHLGTRVSSFPHVLPVMKRNVKNTLLIAVGAALVGYAINEFNRRQRIKNSTLSMGDVKQSWDETVEATMDASDPIAQF